MLEGKIAFLERSVEVLSEAFAEQTRSVHELETRLERLEQVVRDQLRGGAPETGPQLDPPPHY